MTINIDKREIGISIKLFISKQELESEAMQKIADDPGKDFRKQKTYKLLNFSVAKEALLKKIIDNLFSQYSYLIEVIKMSNQFAKNAVKSKVYDNLSPILDTHSRNIFDEMFDIAYGFSFDIKSDNEVYSIKDQYKLSENDLMIATIGTYGYGKTTLIKKIFGFDDFVFPLVDRGRTTINNCYLRGMIVKNGMIQTIKNGEIVNVNYEEYDYENKITLYSPDEFFQSVLVMQISKAYAKFDNLEDTDNFEEEILKEFVTTDAANLDELFGDIDEFLLNPAHESFYSSVLESLSQIKSIMKPTDSLIDIITTLHIKETFITIYEELITMAMEDLKNPTYINNTITFHLKNDELSSIDNYYFKFISNNSKQRGKLVRRLVRDIYLEVDLDTDEIASSTFVTSDSTITSLLFADTMGAGHTTNKLSSKGSENIDISRNFSLLNESDAILLLEDSTQTMNISTLQQIKLLDSYGLRDKTILVYSKYNQFLKGDFKTDNEREKYLINKLEEKLVEIFPQTNDSKTDKAKLIFNMFTSAQNQIVFLKGLIPYVNSGDRKDGETVERKKRKNTSNFSDTENLSDDARAKILNINIEESAECLNDLFCKIHKLTIDLIFMNTQRCTISTNIEDTSLALRFADYYAKFAEINRKNEHSEYILTPPEWNTSEALCYKLYIGETGFYGTSRTLFPLEDAKSEFMLIFNDFIENYLSLQIDGDDSISEDFLKSKIKNKFTEALNGIFYTYFIQLNKLDWHRLYSDGGPGVKLRRTQNIYALINSTFSENRSLKDTAYDVFINSSNQVINYYKS